MGVSCQNGNVKSVGIVALPGAVLYGIASPLHVFGRLGGAHFAPVVLGVTTDPITTEGGLVVQPTHDLRAAADMDVLVVPGTASASTARAPSCVLDVIVAAVRRGATVASVCTGSFIAAQTGLLDTHVVAAHWGVAEALQRRFPRVRVDSNRLFMLDAPVLSCAGSSASYELFLAIYRRLVGPTAARHVAKSLLHPLARDETSPQVIDYPLFRSGGNAILAAQEWRLARIHYRISLEDWSGRFGMSSRRFSRAFFGYAGTTPHQWLTEQRMLLASEHLVGSNASIDEIAAAVGIRSVSAFRSAFTARWGIAPTRYRQLHKDAGGSAVHSLAVET